MVITKVAISSITPNPKNTRLHGEVQIREMIRSIKMFDTIRPIVVDENNVILCGHALYLALQEMGELECSVLVKTNMSEEDKLKLMMADNKLFSLGVDDFDQIDEIMRELTSFDIAGFDCADLEAIYGQSGLEETVSKYNAGESLAQNQNHNTDSLNDRRMENIEQQRHEVDAQVNNQKIIICQDCGARIEV